MKHIEIRYIAVHFASDTPFSPGLIDGTIDRVSKAINTSTGSIKAWANNAGTERYIAAARLFDELLWDHDPEEELRWFVCCQLHDDQKARYVLMYDTTQQQFVEEWLTKQSTVIDILRQIEAFLTGPNPEEEHHAEDY